MEEPQGEEVRGADEGVGPPKNAPIEQFADEPKAYAFDGWTMVPLASA